MRDRTYSPPRDGDVGGERMIRQAIKLWERHLRDAVAYGIRGIVAPNGFEKDLTPAQLTRLANESIAACQTQIRFWMKKLQDHRTPVESLTAETKEKLMKSRSRKTEQPRHYHYTQARGGRIFGVWPHGQEEFRVPTELRDEYENYLASHAAHENQPSEETKAQALVAWSALFAALNSGRRRRAA